MKISQKQAVRGLFSRQGILSSLEVALLLGIGVKTASKRIYDMYAGLEIEKTGEFMAARGRRYTIWKLKNHELCH